MRVIKIKRNHVSKSALANATAVLRAGGVVAFPTETAYGLAADPGNAAAVKKIFRIKGRSERKALPLVAASIEDVRRRFGLNVVATALAECYWPGALTLILPIRKGAKVVSTGSDGTAAVRVPALAWARAIADAGGGVVTSTSANVSGSPNLYSGRAVMAEFRGRKVVPDLLLDAGRLPRRMPSTILRIRKGFAEVLRQGAVSVKEGKLRYH